MNRHLGDEDQVERDQQFGPIVEQSVEDLQKRYGLPATGVADPATIDRLDGPSYTSKYSASQEVEHVQRALLLDSVDGIWGPDTDERVEEVQIAGLVDVDKRVGAETWAVMPQYPHSGESLGNEFYSRDYRDAVRRIERGERIVLPNPDHYVWKSAVELNPDAFSINVLNWATQFCGFPIPPLDTTMKKSGAVWTAMATAREWGKKGMISLPSPHLASVCTLTNLALNSSEGPAQRRDDSCMWMDLNGLPRTETLRDVSECEVNRFAGAPTRLEGPN